jgi:hypothetical protein
VLKNPGPSVRRAVLGSVLAALGGCAASPAPDPYWPDRRDYIAFREAHHEILDPNYLPFMLHRFEDAGPEGDLLILCRWDSDAMPIEVAIEAPAIPESLQHEVHRAEPQLFVASVEHALRIWQRELEGLVTFRRIGEGEEPELRIRLLAERAPTPRPDVVVLGATEALLAACRPEGWDPNANRLQVRFDVPELVLYLADEHGLLTPGQVERVALHEIGHALGMLGHSPMPDDMMFAAYRERSAVETLSESDVNSFVSLYRMPNGAHYGHVAPGRATPRLPPLPPSGTPELQVAPQVDTARGYSIQLPAGWLWADAARGLFAANGPIWDYDASLELSVWPYGDVESFLARYARWVFEGAWLRSRAPTALAGREGLRVEVEDAAGRNLRDIRLLPLGDGRLLMIVAQCPIAGEEAWAAWFEASLATLELASENLEWH